MSARQSVIVLAALKALKDHLAGLDKEEKKALLEELDPGDRKNAVIPGTKTSIGTVSVSQREGGWEVVDERAFLGWVKKNRPSGVVESVRESDQKSILTSIDETGEVPDGVMQGDDGDPYVTVRQTPAQREALIEAWRTGAIELPDALPALGAGS